jgi:hypothetical protein
MLTERCLDLCENLGGRNGVAAELKETLADTYLA